MSILAGSTLGGGTRVNWQASFKTPDHVRREWAQEHGLSAVTSERYTAALDAVCTRLGVTTGGRPPKLRLPVAHCGACTICCLYQV